MKKHIYNEQNGLHYTLHGDECVRPTCWNSIKVCTAGC